MEGRPALRRCVRIGAAIEQRGGKLEVTAANSNDEGARAAGRRPLLVRACSAGAGCRTRTAPATRTGEQRIVCTRATGEQRLDRRYLAFARRKQQRCPSRYWTAR